MDIKRLIRVGTVSSVNAAAGTVRVAFAAQDDLRYMLIGFVTGNSTYQQMVKEEINSFRVDGLPPAPLPRNTPFAVPNTEVPAALPQPAN